MSRARKTWVSGITGALLVLGVSCGGDSSTPGGVMTTAGTPAVPPTAGTIAAAAGTSSVAGSISTQPPRAGTGLAGTGTGAAGSPVAMAGRGGPAGTGASAGMTAAGAGGMTAAGAGGSAGMTPPPPSGDGPPLPAIMGDCPMFMNGSTIMAAGHKSILIASGDKGKGGPLLFYWHGTGGSAAEAMRTLPAAVRMEILSSGGIIAAFNGNQSSGQGGDCSGTGAHYKADFDAADVIAACAVKNYGIDSHRIYTTGCSAGGLQSGCMAQMRSSYIAASAPNSGGVVSPQPWQDMHSPAIFTMHGGSSDMVIVTFSQTSATLDMNAKMHGSFVVNCNHGGGHCQAPAALQTAAWQFMKDHPWGFTKSPWLDKIPAGVPDYCKIY
jgi:predicted esterase